MGMTVKQYQEDPYSNYLKKVAIVESGNNPNAKAKISSALGSYQFIDSTWNDIVKRYKLGYTLNDRRDPVKAEKVARIFTKENEQQIQPILGRPVQDADRYLTHFLGVQGASNFFKAQKKDSNMPVDYFISPSTLNANKGVFYNKDGSVKTVSQVYDWSAKKIGDVNKIKSTYSKEVEPYITPSFTNFDNTEETTNLAEETEQEVEGVKPAEEATKVLTQKQAEKKFLQDYAEKIKQQPTAVVEEQPQQPIQRFADITDQYNEVSQFVNNPLMQEGGIPVSSRGVFASNGKPVIVPAPNITMKNVNYPIIAKSIETGEQKILEPNKDYFFKNTKNVLEIPIWTNKHS